MLFVALIQNWKVIALAAMVATVLIYRAVLVHQRDSARAQVTALSDAAAALRAENASMAAAVARQNEAIDALQGKVIPQSVKLPLAIAEDPNFNDGRDFYATQSDNFFVGNSFPTCGINFSAQEIMGQSKENK